MVNKEKEVAQTGSNVDFDVLEKCCKLISKHLLKELTLHPDGTITIVKEIHTPPKAPRVRKTKKQAPTQFVPNTDLALVAANINNKADRNHLNNFTRYIPSTVLPNQGKE